MIRSSTQSRGFTIIELIVVMGIILLLAGILLPVGLKAMRKGDLARTQADFSAIAAALDAYKADFGDYPRVQGGNAANAVGPNTGFAVLAMAMFSPGSVNNPTPVSPHKVGAVYAQGPSLYVALRTMTSAPPGGTDQWAKLATVPVGNATWNDGADGPGFRLRAGGKVYTPYLRSDKFKIRADGLAILDRSDSPILYFPASSRKPNISDAGNYVGRSTLPPAGIQPGQKFSLIDADDNLVFFRTTNETDDINALARLRMMLGDFGCDGGINNNSGAGLIEKSSIDAPFILWSAGPDKFFGPIGPVEPSAPSPKTFPIYVTVDTAPKWRANAAAVTECDDSTNVAK